jgi:outer membrane protein TolC
VRTARAQVAGLGAETVVAREAAAQAAAGAYVAAARAAAVLQARRADSALAAELVEIAAAQRDAGVGTVLDVTRATAQLVEAREGVSLAKSRLAGAKVVLARALGLPQGTVLELTDSLGADLAGAWSPPATRAEAVARAERQRPDLELEEARGEAARRGAAAIAAERLPRLELLADYGLNGRAAPEAIATRQVGIQVTVPLLDGWRREGRLDEQRAAIRVAEVRRADLEQQLEADVELALLDLESAAAQQAIAAERLRLAEEEVAQARERLTIGTAGNLEVITAQISLLRARDAVIEARHAAATARLTLARAVGNARGVR